MRNARLRIAAATILAGVVTTSVANAQARPPARSFEQLQLRLHPGDAVAVDRVDGPTLNGQVLDVSATSLRLATAEAIVRLEEAGVRRIRLRDPIDPPKVKRGALLGVGAAFLCMRFAECRPWKAQDLTLGSLIGAWAMVGGGAAAGAITAAAIDARHMPAVFAAPETPKRASHRAVGISVTLRF